MTSPGAQPFEESDGFRPVVEHLITRGLLTDREVHVSRLSGGVSNDVLAVQGAGVRLIVKRALARLRVAEEWYADPARILAEAAALELAAAIQPARVPPVLDVDEQSRIVVIGFAEDGAHEWKSELLAGDVDLAVGDTLGRVLAQWHAETRHSADIRTRFGSLEAFGQLRVEPFYEFTAGRHPEVGEVILQTAHRMLGSQSCLVHGDFSPKNILRGPNSTWVIDWEVAHYGDPVFDLAFLLTHLACKALHRPDRAEQFRRLADVFLAGYRQVEPASDAQWDEAYLTRHVACLLLARIDGKSPVDYLDRAARERGRTIALDLLTATDLTLVALWKALA